MLAYGPNRGLPESMGSVTGGLRAAIASQIRRLAGDEAYVRLRSRFKAEDSYLYNVKGVIHIGANTGQERDLYAAFGLDVVWVEPIPWVFEKLQANLAGYPRQRAYNYLLADDEREYDFHIADNEGASSSIWEFSGHTAMWPDIRYNKTVTLQSITLSSLARLEHIEVERFNSLVLDTQGSELKILKGAGDLLAGFRFIKAEAADFEAYKGCCLVGEIGSFLAGRGFRERSRRAFRHLRGVGTYFDVVFERRSGSH